MDCPIAQQLNRLINQWNALHTEQPATVIMDRAFPSPCYQGKAPDGEPIEWQPVQQDKAHDLFDRLGSALELTVHPSVQAYYSQYWSDPLLMGAPDGDLTLLFPWSEPDLERLRENLLGHVFSQMKRKQPVSFFFACTLPDDGILSIRNEDGSVWLEYPKKGSVRKIADDLASFLSTLTPKRNDDR
jgi:SecY interacting protein Syd